jgi:hypothetical protein
MLRTGIQNVSELKDYFAWGHANIAASLQLTATTRMTTRETIILATSRSFVATVT